MKVRELLEKLHDMHRDTEVLISNDVCGGTSPLLEVETPEDCDDIILTHKDGNYVDQIKVLHRTFCFARVERDGKFVDCTSTSNINSKSVDAIAKAVRRADKTEPRF